MNTSQDYLKVILKRTHLIVQRLERLSPDSTWAHSASGYRGALIRVRDRLVNINGDAPDQTSILAGQLNELNDTSFDLLVEAGIELIDY